MKHSFYWWTNSKFYWCESQKPILVWSITIHSRPSILSPCTVTNWQHHLGVEMRFFYQSWSIYLKATRLYLNNTSDFTHFICHTHPAVNMPQCPSGDLSIFPAYISGAKSITMERCNFIGEFHNCEKWHTIALGIARVGGEGKGAWRV